MKPEHCPCCGQVLPPEMALPPVKQRIYDAVRERPRSTDELRDIARPYYTDREFVGWKTIYQHIYQLNRLLKTRSITMRKSGPGDLYRLEGL